MAVLLDMLSFTDRVGRVDAKTVGSVGRTSGLTQTIRFEGHDLVQEDTEIKSAPIEIAKG